MAKIARGGNTPEVCPVCGEALHPAARMCRACGADEDHGWGDADDTGGAAGLPDEDFDYGGFVEREFGGGAKPAGLSTTAWIILLLLILAFLGVFVLSRF